MNIRRMFTEIMGMVGVVLLIAGMTVGSATPATAQAPVPGTYEVRTLGSPATVADAATIYTYVTTGTVNSGLKARVIPFKTADIIVTASIQDGTTYMLAVTPEFSNDTTYFGTASTLSGGSVYTFTKYLTPTGTIVIPGVPIMGEYMRVKLKATGACTPTLITALLRN